MDKPAELESGQKVGFYETVKSLPQKEESDGKKYSFKETFAAAVAKDNFVPNNVWKVSNEFLTAYEQFNGKGLDGYDSLSKEERSKYEPKYWPVIATARTPLEAGRKVLKAQEEEHYNYVIENGSGWGAFAGYAFNAPTSPATYLPITRAAATPKLLTSFSKGSAKALGGLLLGSTIEEANLQWAQETREINESVFNIAASTVTGGLLAGTGNLLTTVKLGIYKDLISETMGGSDVKFSFNEKGIIDAFDVLSNGGSVGSMASPEPIKKIPLHDNELLGVGKDGKITVAKPFFWLAAKGLRNPVVRGLMSKSKTVRGFVNEAYEHNFHLANTATDSAIPVSLQSKISDYRALAMTHDIKLSDFYFEQLGLSPEGSKIGNAIKSSFTKANDGYLSWDKFLKEHALAVVKGGESEFPVISRAAKMTIDFYEPQTKKLIDLKILPPNVTPYGAVQYMNRLYDKDAITATRPQKQAWLTSKFSEINEKIKNATYKMDELENSLGEMKFKLKSDKNNQSLQTQIKRTENLFKKERKKIKTDIRDGKYDANMLVGDRGMTSDQIKQLKQLRKSIDEAKKEAMVTKNKDKLNKLRDELDIQVMDGKLDKSLFFQTKNGNYRLKKVNYGTQKFRQILSEEQLELAAKNTIDNILSMSEEQLGQEINGLFKSGSGGNPLMPRALLLDDVDLLESGFLVSDARKNVQAFMTRMGRVIESEQYFKSKGYDGKGSYSDFLANGIREDYDVLRKQLNDNAEKRASKLEGDKLEKYKKNVEKKRLKLASDEKKDIFLAKTTVNRLMGTVPQSHEGMIRMFRFLNNWAYSSQLGALFLMCMQDAVNPIFRSGIKSYVTEGVLPFITGIAKMKGDNKRLRQAMSDLNIGLETVQAFYGQKFELGLDYELPMNFVERQAKNAANIMGIINLSNSWTDTFKVATGTATTSRLSRNLKQFKAGTLKGKELEQLKILRLNDPIMSNRIVQELETHSEPLNGAILPNIHLWNDGEAAQAFRTAIRKELNSTIFSGKDISSYPLELEYSGIANSLLMYMGYGFNATANYLLPLTQKLDTNKAQAIMAMIGTAMLVDPLRKLSRGEQLTEEDLDPIELFKKGVFNSSILGVYGDIFNRTNSAFDIFPDLQVDRFKNKGKLELISGAPGSFINFLGTLGGQLINNEWNKSDLKTMKRNWPLVEVLWARKIGNDFIDSLDIPETRNKARKQKGD